jgi:trk system potassium uptake protein TrkA
MKVIVMGCGRVGLQVSQMLSNQGHEVTVIDHDANATARLGSDFKGKVVHGIGFDRDVLAEANVDTA